MEIKLLYLERIYVSYIVKIIVNGIKIIIFRKKICKLYC